MSRACLTRDDQLVAFAAGYEFDLDEHVDTCDECQAFLAELWDGQLENDLVQPIVQYLRLELYLIDAIRTGGGLAARMARAALRYLDPAPTPEEET